MQLLSGNRSDKRHIWKHPTVSRVARRSGALSVLHFVVFSVFLFRVFCLRNIARISRPSIVLVSFSISFLLCGTLIHTQQQKKKCSSRPRMSGFANVLEP